MTVQRLPLHHNKEMSGSGSNEQIKKETQAAYRRAATSTGCIPGPGQGQQWMARDCDQPSCVTYRFDHDLSYSFSRFSCTCTSLAPVTPIPVTSEVSMFAPIVPTNLKPSLLRSLSSPPRES
jgi:hypothetical protein